MTYELQVGSRNIPISGYLAVQPFGFDAEAQYISRADRVCVIVNVCQTQSATSDFRVETADLPEWGDFDINARNATTVLAMKDYALRLAATPHSIDMGRAIWVLTPRPDNPERTIKFTPPSVRQTRWNARGMSQYFWGGGVKEGNTELLRASLSVPTYERWGDEWFLSGYLAAGPANAGTNNNTLFEWFGAQNDGALLSRLNISDERRARENEIFGTDEDHQVDADTRGAVFVLNGRLLEAPWPELEQIVRKIAEHDHTNTVDAGYTTIVRGMPITAVDQSLLACNAQENRSSASLGIESADFEGIVVWGLKQRSSGPAVPIHI